MSAAVVAEGNYPGPGAMRTLLKFPDFILLGVALPIFLLADLPIAGWIVAAVGWFVQAIVIGNMEQRAIAATEPRHQVGFVVGGSLVRAWLAAGAILVAYLVGGDDAGLACALLMIALFTIYFLNKMFIHLIRPADKA